MCENRYFEHIDIVRAHLLDKGIDNKYTRWFHHGEACEVLSEDEDNNVPGGDCSEGL